MARQPTPGLASPSELQARWAQTFRAYLADRDERGLGAAYALGRQAVTAGLSALHIVEAHHLALASALNQAQDAEARTDVVQAGAEFLREGISMFEVAARGYQEAQEEARVEHEHVRQLGALADASVAINSSLSAEEILQLTADAARDVLDAQQAVVTSVATDPGARRITATSPGTLTGIEDASELTIPFMWRGRQLGTMTVRDRPHREFTRRDEAILTQLGLLAAVARSNAELYQRQLTIAQKLQRSLRPGALPSIFGLEAGVRFRAAGEGVEVGGDFYDLFEIGRDAAVALVGDVCGKGPDAAAITALARHTLRTAAEFEHSPSAILALLHRALRQRGPDDRFCTVAYAHLTISGHGIRMRLACGGHPLPLVVHSDGSVEPVGRIGTLLGSTIEPRLEEITVDLAAGDACVLYTDGVTEVRRHRTEVFGPAELGALLAGCGGLAPDDIAERVETAVMRASGGTPRDDIAVLVLSPAGIPAMLPAASLTTMSTEEVHGAEA